MGFAWYQPSEVEVIGRNVVNDARTRYAGDCTEVICVSICNQRSSVDGACRESHATGFDQKLAVATLRLFWRYRCSCHVSAMMITSRAVMSSNHIECVNVYR